MLVVKPDNLSWSPRHIRQKKTDLHTSPMAPVSHRGGWGVKMT